MDQLLSQFQIDVMSEIEMLELDAEMRIAHMNGDATAFEWSEAVINYIPRLAWLESQWGKCRDSDDAVMNLYGNAWSEAFAMFSLFIAAELRHQMEHSAKLM